MSSSLTGEPRLDTAGQERNRSVDARAILVVVVAALAMAATLPGRTFGLGLVTDPLMRDLGLDAAAWAHVNLLATLIGSLFCFPAGRLMDRYGASIVLLGTLAALGATTFALGRATDYTTLLVLVTLTRGFGQSALSVVSIALVGKSFDRRLTWPTAVYSVLMTVAFVATFQAIGYFLKQPGVSWRDVWVGLGTALAIAGPLGWLALRGCNLPARTAAADISSHDLAGFTLRKAMATPAFWVFAGATSLFGMAASGLTLFNVPLLAERNLTFENYLKMQYVSMPLGLLGQACCGLFARRISYRRILAVAMLIYALGLVAMTRVSSPAELNLCGCVVGFSGGMITVIFFAIWGRLFGLRELGRIQGAAQMSTVFASAIGPELFAAAKSTYDSYIPAVYWLAPAIVLFAAAAWFVRSPTTAGDEGPTLSPDRNS